METKQYVIVGGGLAAVEAARSIRGEDSRGKDTYRKLVRDRQGRLVGLVLIGDLAERQSLMSELEEDAC